MTLRFVWRPIDRRGQLLADDLHPIGRPSPNAWRVMVYGREDLAGDRVIPLLLMLSSATEPHAAELIRTSLDRNVLRPLAERLDGPDAEVRAAMVIAQCTGFAILNQMLRPRALAEAQQEELVALL
jgi:Tetracyclin repressor-like, C-terminal domain